MNGCKHCGSKEVVQNGWVRDQQRSRCKRCGLNFVMGDKRVEKAHTIKIEPDNSNTRHPSRAHDTTRQSRLEKAEMVYAALKLWCVLGTGRKAPSSPSCIRNQNPALNMRLHRILPVRI